MKVERTISVRNADGVWTEMKTGATVPLGSYVKVRVAATPLAGTAINYTLLESPKPAAAKRSRRRSALPSRRGRARATSCARTARR